MRVVSGFSRSLNRICNVHSVLQSCEGGKILAVKIGYSSCKNAAAIAITFIRGSTKVSLRIDYVTHVVLWIVFHLWPTVKSIE
jgi:hypothetical protein